MAKYRVNMGTNSEARKADLLNDIPSAKARHNGGKVIIVTLDDADAKEAEELFDADRRVLSYSREE